MEPEKGEYGLWYAGTVGFATKEEAQAYIDRGMKHYDYADAAAASSPKENSRFGTYALISIAAVAVLAYGGFSLVTSGKTKSEPERPSQQQLQLNDIKVQRLARGFVLDRLKDPDSAKFRNQQGMCGEVNAKNAYGGYVGFRRFMAGSEKLVIMEGDIPAETFNEVWVKTCS